MSKKRKVFEISGEALMAMFTTGNEQRFRILDGFPEDARIVQSGVNLKGSIDFAVFYLTVESDTFPEVAEGSVMTPVPILIETLK